MKSKFLYYGFIHMGLTRTRNGSGCKLSTAHRRGLCSILGQFTEICGERSGTITGFFPEHSVRRPILHTLFHLLYTLTRMKKGRSLFGNQTALYRKIFFQGLQKSKELDYHLVLIAEKKMEKILEAAQRNLLDVQWRTALVFILKTFILKRSKRFNFS